jgi:hypothetical protein
MFSTWSAGPGRVTPQQALDVRGMLFADVEGDLAGNLTDLSVQGFGQDEEVGMGVGLRTRVVFPGCVHADGASGGGAFLLHTCTQGTRTTV